MNAAEATHVNTIILIVLAGSTLGLMTMVIWLIGLVRELRTEVKNQAGDLVKLASQTGHAEGQLLGRREGRDEIRTLRAKEPGGPLTHTDDHGS